MLRIALTVYFVLLFAFSVGSTSLGYINKPMCGIKTVTYWDAVFPARLLGCGIEKTFKEIHKVMSKDIHKF